MDKKSISAKKKARRLALQALYQWLLADTPLYEIEAQFKIFNNMDKVDSPYFSRLLHEIPSQLQEIENSVKPYLDREITSLNPIELTVLRIGAFELLYCPDIPYKVVLDESISLAKEYGSQDGHRYVNGILNNLAKNVRAVEISLANE